MARQPLARCKRHPSATAGWHCEGCDAALCPDCVVAKRMHTVDLLSCRECGGQAEPIVVHRSEQASLSERLAHVWRYPFNASGVALVLGLGTVLTALGFMTGATLIVARLFPAALTAGIFWGSLFSIIRASARGEDDIPSLDYSDFFVDGLIPSFRALVATCVLWLPLLGYLLSVGGFDVLQYMDRLLSDPMFYMTGTFHSLPGERLLNDPWAWALGLASLAYLPMALMLAATGASLLDLLNPLKGLRLLLRLGRDYAVTLGALLPLGLAFLVVGLVADGIRAVDLGIVTRWPAELLELFVPLLMARVLGLLLYTRGDVLGYGAARDYWSPVLAHATPSTSLRVNGALPAATEEATPEAPAPVEQVQALTRAVEGRDVPLALALYQMMEGVSPASLPPALHLFVGQASATQGDYALAVRALETAADVAPEDPLAPRALVLLARVLGERMQDAGRAREVFQYIVDRYPDTDASRFAQAQLPPTT